MQLQHIIHTVIKDIEIMTAVVFGMFMQFIFGAEKSLWVGVLIVVSSVFVALYVVAPSLIVFDIQHERIKAALYALSSLISVELLALLLVFLPKALREKVKVFLGVKDDTKD